ncbi:hypothetical protein HETIRDRAFT_418228 [Heterobasidion irregulare TC 32-1]|uniref:Uncharacterized protein n=1 Tax=Heterobasidion irregulare (strain TC 32-1) TaxID=747525 RepID=W4KB87_HETIT|nr:uncharacterized protein HETIRDRAFT_418228 [Heterobasidion irregulare TC 32-1]ETW82306.1 hypothetical protein HETIRDRAFT_418228 [Heterobasidion irregulare TC 32-1]
MRARGRLCRSSEPCKQFSNVSRRHMLGNIEHMCMQCSFYTRCSLRINTEASDWFTYTSKQSGDDSLQCCQSISPHSGYQGCLLSRCYSSSMNSRDVYAIRRGNIH